MIIELNESVIDQPIHEITMGKNTELKSKRISLMCAGGKLSEMNRRPLTIEKRDERDSRQGNHSVRRIEMSGNESQTPSSDRAATQARRTRLHNRRTLANGRVTGASPSL